MLVVCDIGQPAPASAHWCAVTSDRRRENNEVPSRNSHRTGGNSGDSAV